MQKLTLSPFYIFLHTISIICLIFIIVSCQDLSKNDKPSEDEITVDLGNEHVGHDDSSTDTDDAQVGHDHSSSDTTTRQSTTPEDFKVVLNAPE